MNEELEYSISQYLDGALSPDDEAQLLRRLAADSNARALLEEYRKLDRFIQASAPPIPEMNWDGMAGQISETIARAEQQPESYKIESHRPSPWLMRGRGIALAASVLIALGVAFHIMRSKPGDVMHDPAPQVQLATAEVHGPAPEAATGIAVAEVSLSAPAASAEASREYPYAEGVVVQPSHVSIASAVGAVQ